MHRRELPILVEFYFDLIALARGFHVLFTAERQYFSVRIRMVCFFGLFSAVNR